MQDAQREPAPVNFEQQRDTGSKGDEAEPRCDSTAPTQETEERYPVTLDSVGFERKPKGAQLGAITNRLEQAGASYVTMPELWALIKSGHTFTCGTFEPRTGGGWGAFLGQRLFGVDVDNHFGKFDLQHWEQGYLGPFEAVSRCLELGIQPVLLYFTMSSDLERGRYRFRLLFDAHRVITDFEEAKRLQAWLLGKFPEADQACSNPHSRLWLGTTPKRGGWELWRIGRDYWKGARQ